MKTSITNTKLKLIQCLQNPVQKLTRKADHAVAPNMAASTRYTQTPNTKLYRLTLQGGGDPGNNWQVQGLEFGANIVFLSNVHWYNPLVYRWTCWSPRLALVLCLHSLAAGGRMLFVQIPAWWRHGLLDGPYQERVCKYYNMYNHVNNKIE